MGLQTCIGIDPNLKILGGFLKEEFNRLGVKVFLSKFGKALVDVAFEVDGQVKFQSAYFEALGAIGIESLKELSFYATARGVPTILDAKRTDIGPTMSAYLTYAFDYLKVDSMTVVPYMGLESIFNEMKNFSSKRLFIVGLSSNADGIKFQSLRLSSGNAVYEHIIETLLSKKDSLSLGLVIGGTEFDRVDSKWLGALSNIPILVPGFGAQNAKFPNRLKEVVSKTTVLTSSSRGLSLSGMADEKLASWDDYADIVKSRCNAFSKNMWENCHK